MMPLMQAGIQIKNLSYQYTQKPLFENLNLQIKAGESVAFLGTNGAGKSTLFQLLAGVLRPNQGDIEVVGTSMVHHPQKAKAHIGFLNERNPLYEDMTPFEHLLWAGRLRLIEGAILKNQIQEALYRFGLGPVAHKWIGELSKGYRQRVGLALALFHHPQVLILDEPFNGLDPHHTQHVIEHLQSLKDHIILLMSTHILSEAHMVCDRLVTLTHGKIASEDG